MLIVRALLNKIVWTSRKGNTLGRRQFVEIGRSNPKFGGLRWKRSFADGSRSKIPNKSLVGGRGGTQ